MTKTERRRREQFNADGLPRDAKLWTVADWKSLWDAYRQIVREVGERHKDRAKGNP